MNFTEWEDKWYARTGNYRMSQEFKGLAKDTKAFDAWHYQKLRGRMTRDYMVFTTIINLILLYAVIKLYVRDDALMDKLIETVELVGRLH